MRATHQLPHRSMRQVPGRTAVAVSLVAPAMTGCSAAPSINLLGSYFPSWIVCLGIAVVLTFLAHVYVTKKNFAEKLWPLSIVYTALLCLLTCTLWLTFFR